MLTFLRVKEYLKTVKSTIPRACLMQVFKKLQWHLGLFGWILCHFKFYNEYLFTQYVFIAGLIIGPKGRTELKCIYRPWDWQILF